MKVIHLLKKPLFIALAFVLVIIAIVLLFEFSYSQNPKLTIDFNKEDQSALELLNLEKTGFFAKEKNTNLGYFRWTKPQFSLNLTHLAKADYTLRLWLHPPDRPEPTSLSIRANDKEVTLINPVTPGMRQYDITVPANMIQDGTLDIQFQAPEFVVKNDPRGRLGIIVTRIEVERMAGGLLIPPRSLFISVGLLLGLWAILVFGVYPHPRRWQYWAAFLPIALIQSIWLSLQLSIGAALDELFFNFSRLALMEYALVFSVLIARFFMRWWEKKPGSSEKEIVAGGEKEIFPLSSLRFIAAIMVLFVHLPIDRDWPLFFYSLIRNSFIGVSLFFVLSGFILCYTYYPAFQKGLKGKLWNFWVARFARIYPMYLLTLLLSLFIQNSFAIGGPFYSLVHLLGLQTYISDPYYLVLFNVPSWSVSAEIFFYMLFPFLLYLSIVALKTAPQLFVTGFVLLVIQFSLLTAATGWNFTQQYYIFYNSGPGRLCEFLIGLLAGRLFLLWRHRPVSKMEVRWVSLLVAASVVGVIGIMTVDKTVLQIYRFGAIYAVPFAIIIFWLARYNTRISKFMSAPVFVLLGEASYSFYLLHMLVILIMNNLFSEFFIGVWNYALYGSMLILTTALSLILFQWYETPARVFLRKRLLRK
jgi:peptidoglycan/LPS O-acetylase OafA/YrhL